MEQTLQQQFDFLLEIDKMKTILRRNVISDESRRENDAEHSWHMAMTAIVLAQYAAREVDMLRVLKMALVHDLVEVYAGDTFCYDTAGYTDKAQREQSAASKLFAMLPTGQGDELRRLWEEFEAEQTPEALFACACDRIQPFLLNYNTHGHTWKLGGIHQDQVYARMAQVKAGAPKIYAAIDDMIQQCVRDGLILE